MDNCPEATKGTVTDFSFLRGCTHIFTVCHSPAALNFCSFLSSSGHYFFSKGNDFIFSTGVGVLKATFILLGLRYMLLLRVSIFSDHALYVYDTEEN
jgi:hypothetical protein